ncbi:uncharacterized protein PV09_00634 [Verruconis gallopava]|uniref:Uncharacterized protein n=1 Tax=Verruconis gallopava TaxID=253628 RepID=A0A0D2BBH6_9PEZI|nr:uncharacterized protein PV09_00634 [Verruconis gallopava]KIW08684.1 hypothetical protein PV09_00634 [Verruconis gallopava]
MASFASTNLRLKSNQVQPRDETIFVSELSFLELDGYKFAIDQMHLIMSRYPSKSELYLHNVQAPDLHDYLAWKAVSHMAVLNRFNVQNAVDAHTQLLGEIKLGGHSRDTTGMLPRHSYTAQEQADPLAVEAALILMTMSFEASCSSGFIHPYNFSMPTNAKSAERPPSPVFPVPEDLPLPKGSDAFLLNPVLEDIQKRWVRGICKEDQIREVVKKDKYGGRYVTRKTIYVVDGEEFIDVLPHRQAGTVSASIRHSPTPSRSSLRFADHSVVPIPSKELRSRKRPLDSGISLDDKFEGSPHKHMRSNFNHDVPSSSIFRPSVNYHKAANVSTNTSNASSRSTSSGSHVSIKDVDNLRAVLDPVAMDSVMGAFGSTGQVLEPVPQTDGEKLVSSSGMGRSKRRRAPPPPLNLVRPTTSRDSRRTPPSMSRTPVGTTQNPSASRTTHKKSKYVPTTPNPQRWTAQELYHLNGLARLGLHPRELHPKMLEQFPDKQRSLHAIKDRRDKMARNKELQGKMPDYQARYGHI